MSLSEMATLIRRWCIDITCEPKDAWMSQLTSALTAEPGTPQQVAGRFLRQGQVVDQFLRLLYKIAMGREPTKSDLEYWRREYAKNLDILHCCAIFLASDEFYIQQCGSCAALFPSRVIAVTGCEGLGLDEATLEALASENKRADAVETVLRHPSVRLRIATLLTFCLGLAELDADTIGALANNAAGPCFVEAMLVRLLSHPRYIAQAQEGSDSVSIHRERLITIIGNIVSANAAAMRATIAEDIRIRLPDRRLMLNYLADLLDRPGRFERLMFMWSLRYDIGLQSVPTEIPVRHDRTADRIGFDTVQRWKWLSFGETAGSLRNFLDIDVNTSQYRGAVTWPVYRSELLKIALPLIERWIALYGRFLKSIDQPRTEIVNMWAARLVDSDGLLLTFCEFILSPVCCGNTAKWFFNTIGQISPAPGCFVVHPGLEYETDQLKEEPVNMLATSYFYWYDNENGSSFIACPDTLVNDEGVDSLTLRPASDVPFSYNSFAWHSRQLADMVDAGVNVVLPVSYTHPFSDPSVQASPLDVARNSRTVFTDIGLRALRCAWLDLAASGTTPPLVAMFYDTSTLNGVNVKELKIDFRQKYAFHWFYESIRNFFSHFPRPMWALRDGHPIVFVYHPCFGAHVSDGLYKFVRGRFAHDFGTDLYIVTAAEEEAPRVLNADRLRPWAERLSTEMAYDVLADILSEDELYRASGGTDSDFCTVFLRRLGGHLPSDAEISSAVVTLNLVGRLPFVRAQLASDSFFLATLCRWFHRLLRVDFDIKQSCHVVLATQLRELLLMQGDVLGALIHIVDTPMFLAAAGGTSEFLIDWIYQSIVWKHPNPDCAEGSTTSTDIVGRSDFLEDLLCLPRRQVISKFLSRYEVREAVVSGWFFDHYGHYNPGPADAQFYWSGAISPTIRDVASVGPGYDQSKLRNRPGLVMPRRDGRTYRAVLDWILSMDPRPGIVHLETWNEYFEGSCICETKEFGRSYIDMSRNFADQYIRRAPKTATVGIG